MEPDTLPDRLEADEASPSVAAFPDGSVDTFYEVHAGGERFDTTEDFADLVAGEQPMFSVRREVTEPGGHAVNIAGQAARLGNDVTLAGHLDDSTFTDLPFETVSMGDPATVSVYGFDDDDVLAVEGSPDIESWSFADLEDALGNALSDFISADVVCCANWTSIDGLPDALDALADAHPDGERFVLDPGSLEGRSRDEHRRLFDALDSITGTYDVIVTGNPEEISGLATEDPGSPRDTDTALRNLRDRAGVSAVVVHGVERAAVANEDGVRSEENFVVDPRRHTGGGDRFDAGLAHALARGWGWSDALRLGNACASWYIATGSSGTPRELADFIRNPRPAPS